MLTLPYDIFSGHWFSYAEYPSLSCSPLRSARRFEIELFLDEKMVTYLDGEKYVLEKGDILIVKPGQKRYSQLPFNITFVKFSVDGDLNKLLSSTPQLFKCKNISKICDLFNQIISLEELSNDDNDIILRHSLILKLIYTILTDSKAKASDNIDTALLIQQAKSFIKEHYAEQIHLEDIAATVNLSPIYFHNIFSGTVGQTPHDYLISYRIKKAKKMLWDYNNTISEVAVKCGFGSQQYFTKIFKKETGYSPGKYRKAFNNKYLED